MWKNKNYVFVLLWKREIEDEQLITSGPGAVEKYYNFPPS